MTNWSSPLRGPFRDINDTDLKLGGCDFCGKSENTDVISRAPCENCKKVVCWECADCGVYSSLHDFQYFIHRHTLHGKEVYILAESCPNCQETSWWERYTASSKNNQTINSIGDVDFQPGGQSVLPRKIVETPFNRYNLEEVESTKTEAIKTAENILSGKTGIIEGARILTAISHKLDSVERDSDFLVFIATASETDHLPVGKERELWAKAALQEKDIEIKQAENFHKENIFSACRALLEKWKHVK
ncbi:MAG: DUF2489 domain-containing protein [Anaerolineales bacterium]|nr:DUF2489 domain-containing protein [Anaerolineales bacterium]